MRAKHACNSYKCITRLIVTGTRHYYAGWAWSCTNFVHSARTAQYAPLASLQHHQNTFLQTTACCNVAPLHSSSLVRPNQNVCFRELVVGPRVSFSGGPLVRLSFLLCMGEPRDVVDGSACMTLAEPLQWSGHVQGKRALTKSVAGPCAPCWFPERSEQHCCHQ